MKKILYIVSTLKRTGPTSQLLNIIKHLDRSKFIPYLVTLSPEPAESRWQDYQEAGVNLYSLKLSRVKGLFFAKYELEKLIKIIRPELIHTQGVRADLLSSKLDVDTPRVSTIRNYPQEDYLMTYGKIQGGIMVNLHVSAFRKMDLCIGVSKAVEKNINKLFLIKKTENIPNGVDIDQYHPVSQDVRNSLRQRLNLPLYSRIWVSTGHLSSRKDPLFLIEQWKRLFGDSKENCLLFLGGGELERECQLAISKTDNIIVNGHVDNVVDYLQASDYFISASKAEGLPNAVIEALACGLPCLLSDIAPHQEVLSMNKSIGGMFRLGNSESFVTNLKCLQKRDYSVMREAALYLIEARLSAKVMSKDYQGQYENLIGLHK